MTRLEILEKLVSGYYITVWTDYDRQRIWLTNGDEKVRLNKDIVARIEASDMLELKERYRTLTAGKSHVALRLKPELHWKVKNMIWNKKK